MNQRLGDDIKKQADAVAYPMGQESAVEFYQDLAKYFQTAAEAVQEDIDRQARDDDSGDEEEELP